MNEHPTEDLGFELPAPAKSSRTRVAIVIVAVIGSALALRYVLHSKGRGEAAVATTEPGALHVEVIKPKTLASDPAIELPGAIQALEETKLYPRAAGYVRKWNVDIGDKVKEGQLLAEIDTPELDAQIAQGRAQLAQAQAAVKQAIAQRDLAKSTLVRTEGLAQQSLVSKAQVEQTQADAQTGEANVAAAQSNVTAQEANLRRLIDTKSFANVTAPFAGTITSRSIDRGSLVSDNGTTPMYTLDATDPVRVFVDVPQTVAPSVQVGTAATIEVRVYAGRKFSGKVTRSAGALDPDLHVMHTEIQVPNPDGALLPGMYCQATITLAVPRTMVEIPATALYNDAQGTRVVVVDAQNKVHYQPIKIERDTGASLWVATELTGEARVLKIAVPTLVEGDLVEATLSQPPAQGSGAGVGSAQKSSR
jgi:RND family efflux transporter MFP subunit